MTPEQIEQERTAFEAWVKGSKEGGLPVSLRKDKEKSYFNPLAEVSFMAWLARAEQSSWISVEEDLPDYGITVLTATEEGFVTTCQLVEERGADFGYIWRFASTSSPITHWQPMPKPPAGEEQ